MSTFPKIKYFGDKLADPNIEDDDLVRSFFIVVLATFLCPSSNTTISPDYLAPLVNVKEANKWDWSKLVFVWLMKKVKKYQDMVRSGKSSSVTLGGCLYYLCVVFNKAVF